MKRIFLAFVGLFFIYSIMILFEDKYEIHFETDFKTLRDLKYGTCLSLELLKLSYSSNLVDLRNLSDEAYNFVAKFKDKIFKKTLMNAIEEKRYYFFNYHFCFILTIDEIYQAETFLEIETDDQSKHFIFEKYPFQFFSDDFHGFHFKLILIQNLEYPYGFPYSNCQQYLEETADRTYYKFICINKCYKRELRSLKYFYSSNETGLVDVNCLEKAKEQKCVDACKRDTCKFFYQTKSLSNTISRASIKHQIAYPLLSNLDFYLQLLSLISLFFDFSIYDKLIYLIKLFLDKHLKDELRKTKSLIRMKIIVFTACLISISIVYYFMISTFIFNRNQPIKREINYFNFDSEKFSIYICVPLEELAQEDFGFGLFDDQVTNDQSKIKENMTFQEVENITNDLFNRSVKAIYLSYEDKNQSFNWKLNEKKVLFHYYSEPMRCFHVIILDPQEPKYQSIVRISKIVIDLKINVALYLKSGIENLHFKTDLRLNGFSIKKQVYQRSRNCIDYAKKYLNLCDSRENCIERCINMKFFENYLSITDGIVIDKDHLTKEQYNTVYFNKAVNLSIKEECRNEFVKLDCTETLLQSFEEVVKDEDNYLRKIEIYYDIAKEIESYESDLKLCLNLLNALVIFFGVNYQMLIKSISKISFKKRIIRIIYFIILFIGCSMHFYLTFEELILGKMMDRQFFESIEVYEMPEIIICLKFDTSFLDANHRLTGDFLAEKSSNLNLNTVLEKIVYLNESNDFTTLKGNFNRKLNSKLKISTFFFQRKKCFQIKLIMNYYKKSFYFNDDLSVLEVYLNRSIAKHYNYYFFFKKRNTMELSEIYKFSLNIYKYAFTDWKISYEIELELNELEFIDKFRAFRNPLILWYGENDIYDVTSYLNRLKTKFNQDFNFSTSELFINEDDFKLQIENDLFHQYFLQIQNKTDFQAIKSRNFTRSFYLNYYSVNQEFNIVRKPHFKFIAKFFRVKLVISNEDSFVKLILNLINILSFWFNWFPFDFYIYFFKINLFIKFLYNSLIRLKDYLNSLKSNGNKITSEMNRIPPLKKSNLQISKFHKYSQLLLKFKK